MPEIRYNPQVSLDENVKYTTAASSYDRLLDNGPLTTVKILRYARAGRYGPKWQRRAEQHAKRKKLSVVTVKEKKPKRYTLKEYVEDLLKGL